MTIPRNSPNHITTRSVQGGRSTWTATYSTAISERGFRALGTLRDGARVARPSFDVQIDDYGDFAVGVGDGSSIQVKFRHPMFSPTPD